MNSFSYAEDDYAPAQRNYHAENFKEWCIVRGFKNVEHFHDARTHQTELWHHNLLAVLAAVKKNPQLSTQEIADKANTWSPRKGRTRLTVQDVRWLLKELVAMGLIRQVDAIMTGKRGRPAVRWESVSDSMPKEPKHMEPDTLRAVHAVRHSPDRYFRNLETPTRHTIPLDEPDNSTLDRSIIGFKNTERSEQSDQLVESTEQSEKSINMVQETDTCARSLHVSDVDQEFLKSSVPGAAPGPEIHKSSEPGEAGQLSPMIRDPRQRSGK